MNELIWVLYIIKENFVVYAHARRIMIFVFFFSRCKIIYFYIYFIHRNDYNI